MGQGLGKIQKRILEVLAELTRRNERDWFSLHFVTVFLYTPWQIDPDHERNRNRIGKFIADWNMERKHHRRCWESTRMLERRGFVEIRIRKRDEGRIGRTWGGCTRWMEVRKITEEERTEASLSTQHPNDVPYYPH
ncbi:hypothetical protein ES705_47236 [subsurface metagenome]